MNLSAVSNGQNRVRSPADVASDRGLFTMQLLSESSAPLQFLHDHIKDVPGRLEVQPLEIPDVKLIRARRFSDARGYFCETYQQADFAAHGLVCDFLQDNQSS